MNSYRPTGLSMRSLYSSNNILETKPKTGHGLTLEKIGVPSSFASSSSIVLVESTAEAEQLTLQENQARCDYYNKYRHDKGKHLGTGYSSGVYECEVLG